MGFRLVIRAALFLGGTVAIVFGSAGRFDLPFLWAYLGVLVLTWAIVLATLDRGLLKERMNPPAGGTDRRLRFVIMPFFAGLLVVAGLDVGRFHWSYVPAWLQIVALAAVAAGYAVSGWAMFVNRFYSPVVRIQAERGHQLITSGPYARVRHPGYTGALLTTLASGPALGSWWALLPAFAIAGLVFRRVFIEDRYLHDHLDGYPTYAGRVHYRLVPGLW